MKHRSTFIIQHSSLVFALLAAVLMLAACNPEPVEVERDIVYTVDQTTTTVHLRTDAEFDALLEQFCDYVEEGSTVTFYNANRVATSNTDVTRFSTTSRDEMKAWMRQMEDAGKTVTVTFDSGTGTYNGMAYATAPQPPQQEGCYTGVLVYYEEYLPDQQIMSLQVSADSILLIHNNYSLYEDGYLELDGITYHVGDTVTLCGELEAQMYDTIVLALCLNIGEPEPLWIDLGLPSGLLWASHNVGAERPEDYGDYFAWGETQPKSLYHWCSYKYCDGGDPQRTYFISMIEDDVRFTKYCPLATYGYNGYTDTLTILQPEDDAATANWGGDARTPTRADWQELIHYCTVTWCSRPTVMGSKQGFLFTSPNGSNIFLPAAGITAIDEIMATNSSCHYMTSTLYEWDPVRCVAFSSNYYKETTLFSGYRYEGLQVRPVRDANKR